MEFGCSHVVCNWSPEGAEPCRPPVPLPRLKNPPPSSSSSSSLPPPPPIKPRHTPVLQPPPIPARGENRFRANINVISLSVGKLVKSIPDARDQEVCVSPVHCGKCGAALSCLSWLDGSRWACEFCAFVNERVRVDAARACTCGCAPAHGDDLYLHNLSGDDYENLEDSMLLFCIDVSGSMCVTTEVTCSGEVPHHVSRLQGLQEALQEALSSMLLLCPRRRVALVTFSDQVVIYGDGTRPPLTLSDWSLLDYDHIWGEGVAYGVPHCLAETYHQLIQRVKDLREHGATCLGPAVLASVAMASRYPGSKVVLCTDGRANTGLGQMEEEDDQSQQLTAQFYRRLSQQAVEAGVIISVTTFEGTDCRLAEVGRLADTTGGRVNIVSLATIASEFQAASADNVAATGVTATLLAADGVYFPFEEPNLHKVVRNIGNVSGGLEVTFQFAVKPQCVDAFLQKDSLPFQLQLSFKTREQQRVTRIITERRPLTSCSSVGADSLNMAVLGVHGAQLCAALTMDGRVEEAQKQLRAQQHLMAQISEQRPIDGAERIYGNWMDTMTTICDDITPESQTLCDAAAQVIYQMKRATSVNNQNNTTSDVQTKPTKKKRFFLRRSKR